jgi:hypothetical protein
MATLAKILLQTNLIIVEGESESLDSLIMNLVFWDATRHKLATDIRLRDHHLDIVDSVKRVPFSILFDLRERDKLCSDSECLRVVHVYKTGFLIQNV